MYSVKVLPDSHNYLEVILQGSFDIFLEVEFSSRWQVDLYIMHCQEWNAHLNIKRYIMD
jgi:hypothetical protein